MVDTTRGWFVSCVEKVVSAFSADFFFAHRAQWHFVDQKLASKLKSDMDDRREREAALIAFSSHSEEIIGLCKDGVDLLDVFEELKIITEEEKDDANDREDYDCVMDKLREKIDTDPNFLVDSFCRRIRQVEELSSLAGKLVGKLTVEN